MVLPSPSYTITLRVEAPATQRATSELVSEVAATGASVTGVDIDGYDVRIAVCNDCAYLREHPFA